MTRTTMGALLASAILLGACDADRDRDLDDEDLAQAYESAEEEAVEAATGARDALTRLFDGWDEDRDAAFSARELERWWSEANPFDEWDADRNDRLSAAEWDAALLIDLEEVDADRDGEVTRTELEEGLFDALDQDDDRKIGRHEWMRVRIYTET